MNQIKTIFWDMDGTLVDTEVLHFQSWQMLVQKFNKTLTRKEYLPLIGRGGVENVEAVCALKDIPDNCSECYEINEIRRGHYADLRKKGIPFIKLNVNLVKKCAKRFPNINQIVVSSSCRKDIAENVAAAGLQGYFKTTVSFEDVPELKRKPDPDIYLFALKTSGADKNEALAFEDSLNGVVSAKNAGLKCVALPNKLTVNQPLNTLADLVIPPGQKRDIAAIIKLAESF